MGRAIKEFVDFEGGLDILEPTSLHSAWTRDIPEGELKEFKAIIVQPSSVLLWNKLRKIIQGEYRKVSEAPVDFTKGQVELQLLYHEGYKQAIKDIYKLIPNDK